MAQQGAFRDFAKGVGQSTWQNFWSRGFWRRVLSVFMLLIILGLFSFLSKGLIENVTLNAFSSTWFLTVLMISLIAPHVWVAIKTQETRANLLGQLTMPFLGTVALISCYISATGVIPSGNTFLELTVGIITRLGLVSATHAFEYCMFSLVILFLLIPNRNGQ